MIIQHKKEQNRSNGRRRWTTIGCRRYTNDDEGLRATTKVCERRRMVCERRTTIEFGGRTLVMVEFLADERWSWLNNGGRTLMVVVERKRGGENKWEEREERDGERTTERREMVGERLIWRRDERSILKTLTRLIYIFFNDIAAVFDKNRSNILKYFFLMLF